MALRIMRDAALAVGLFTAVPVAIVATKGDRLWEFTGLVENSRGGLAVVAPVRAFALPIDASITPLQAGRAFNSLEREHRTRPDFPELPRDARPVAIWEQGPMPKAPSGNGILTKAATGFSPEEMAYLRTLAGIDLSRRPLESVDVGWTGSVASLAHRAATVAGTVLNNPRLAACTTLLGGLPDR